jgi:integrase
VLYPVATESFRGNLRNILMATISKILGKKGTTYKVRIRKPNNPTVTKSFSSKNLAQKWSRKTELEIEEGTYFDKAESASHTVSELVDRYIEEELKTLSETDWPSRRRQLNWWKDEIGKLTLNKVTPALIVEHRNKLKSGITYRHKPRSGSTVNRYLAAFSAALTIAVTEWQWIQSNPFTRVRREKENNGRVRFLSSDERTNLLEAVKESRNRNIYLITILALSTGMRQAEILSLAWDQVDLDRGVITLYKTKNNQVRVVPLMGFAKAELFRHGKVRNLKNTHVFPGRNHNYAQFPRSAWAAALVKADVSNFTFHDCRHSAASELAMNGASLHEIAAVLGHKTLAMVQRYAHLSEQHTMSVVERMNEAVFGKS